MHHKNILCNVSNKLCGILFWSLKPIGSNMMTRVAFKNISKGKSNLRGGASSVCKHIAV